MWASGTSGALVPGPRAEAVDCVRAGAGECTRAPAGGGDMEPPNGTAKFCDPFPLAHIEQDKPSSGTSKHVKVRHRDRAELCALANDTVDALNDLYGGPGGVKSAPGSGTVDLTVHKHLLHAAKRLRAPHRVEPTGRDALQSLLKSDEVDNYARGGGGSVTKPTFLKVADVARVAEPGDLNRVMMADACTPEFLEGLRTSLTPVLAGTRERRGKVHGAPKAYTAYLRRALGLELIGFCKARDVKAVNDLFFLEKAGKGTLRKIIDCRPSNPYLGQPGPTELGGPWHSMEFTADQFWIGEGDVEAAFTRVQAIPELWAYHCLQPVRICDVVGAAACQAGSYVCPFTGSQFMPGELAWPCYVRLPMGGVRSAEIMQHIATQILIAEFPDSPHFCRPIHQAERIVLENCPGGTAWGLYIDNFYVIGTTKEQTARMLQQGVAALTRAGLLCSIVQPASQEAKSLGFWYDGRMGTVGLPAERMRLLRSAGLWLAEQACVDVDTVERVLGHFTWAFLAQRQLYSVFHGLYEFVRTNRGRRVPWWGSARAELQQASRLVHLAVTDVRRPVAPFLICTDAEGRNATDLGGGGVVATVLTQAEADSFRNDKSWETTPGCAPQPAIVRATTQYDWVDVDARRWRYPAHNNALEFEAVLLAAKAIARTPDLRHTYVPLLTDSSVVLGCMRKGRSSSFALCCKARKLAAFALGWGVHLFPRWVPTALCPADALSRRK